ncbi:hypothetical protein P7K49_026036 [Saguinus oedipus]|uniref:Uncharacterized protein n=1 Tax=Saguinus oedipus TaxID=9490 RepID=A0ABQ9UIW8_SAGOE|nr:hypothetical protein P7K49_026036 [Saguinus oedipus]
MYLITITLQRSTLCPRVNNCSDLSRCNGTAASSVRPDITSLREESVIWRQTEMACDVVHIYSPDRATICINCIATALTYIKRLLGRRPVELQGRDFVLLSVLHCAAICCGHLGRVMYLQFLEDSPSFP